MSVPKVFLIGGVHIKEIPKHILDWKKIDAVLVEGALDNDLLELKNIVREPLFIIGAYLYFLLLRLIGKDQKSVYKIRSEHGFRIHSIDVTITEMVDSFHSPINYLISTGMFCIVYLLSSSLTSWAHLIYALVLSSLGYVVYVVLFATLEMRNKTMARNCVNLIKENKYHIVALSCGYRHIKGIAPLLRKDGLEVVEMNITKEGKE